MKTNLFTFLPLAAGRVCRFFSLSLLFIAPYCLFAQSNKAWQVAAGMEHYVKFRHVKSLRGSNSAGGLFVEGKYQKKWIDFGLKIGAPLWIYGKNAIQSDYLSRNGYITQTYLDGLKGYAELSFNYKPNFRYGKPFMGIGCRYGLIGEYFAERWTSSTTTIIARIANPDHISPVIYAGYYHKNLKFHLNYVFQQIYKYGTGRSSVSGRHHAYLNFGASWLVGVGSRKSAPPYEITFSERERKLRPLAFRLEAGVQYNVTLGKTGIGASGTKFWETKVGFHDQLRIGFRMERPEVGFGPDSKSQELYGASNHGIYSRSVNAGKHMSAYILFGEWVLKRNVSKDLLTVGAGVGLYAIRGSGGDSYRDNGVRIILPAQINPATHPGLHLRVGQRFGAFTHGVFVHVMPGQIPVTMGMTAGLGLNIFGKAKVIPAEK